MPGPSIWTVVWQTALAIGITLAAATPLYWYLRQHPPQAPSQRCVDQVIIKQLVLPNRETR